MDGDTQGSNGTTSDRSKPDKGAPTHLERDRRRVEAEQLQSHLEFWCRTLAGAPEVLQLPLDHARSVAPLHDAQRVQFRLSGELTGRLRQLSQQQGAPLFVTMLSAWAVLLGRWSGQDEVVIGTRLTSTWRSSEKDRVHKFGGLVALRVRLQADPTVEQLLRQETVTVAEARAHLAAPFAQVVTSLGLPPGPGRNPVFQVAIELRSGAVEVVPDDERVLHSTTRFDLHLSLGETGDGLSGMLEYASDLFERGTIRRMADCWEVLLEAMVTDSGQPVSRLPMLSAAEREQVLHSFNDTAVAWAPDGLIHQLFEEQVQRTPKAVALICAGQRLTYDELDKRANQLARHLHNCGVGPEVLVAVFLERGVEMVVGLFGILKAGGAYVPLDPAYPSGRLTYMLDDAAPAVLLTQERLKGRLPRTSAQVISLDSDWADIAQQSSGNPGGTPGLCADHLAYVIYTSGSTGQPKGVAIEHRNAVNLIRWAHSAMAPEVFAQTLQSTSLNFDLSVYECFVPLTAGGSIRVVENALALTSSSADVTLINTVPSAIAAVLDSGTIPETTRVVNLAGEALRKELVERIFACSTVECVNNLYGPSETTTYSTWVSMPRQGGFIASIGRPVANTRIYIFDRHLQLVPTGVTGEIYIGGAGVARGYLNRPELTAERFIRDSYSCDPRARLYRTGDLGRWLADGTLEYLGRNDHQVKIRGHRIELGEIEAQLARFAQVKDAVVVAREDAPGEKRVVAYVVGDRSAAHGPASEGSAETLRTSIVSEWETLWKETYTTLNRAAGPNFAGWNSSYTGEPIPESQMQEWLMGTVGRIKALRPEKVLEIGCGVGLVLQRVAPQCPVYVGTDLSASGLDHLEKWVSRREDLSHVRLLHRAATELQDVKSGSFDTIVLNSVVQYFPDIEYLLAVLKEAVRLVVPGGKIFIGDVRHLGLLPVFHSAVQLSRAAPAVSIAQLRKRISRAVAQEKELVVDPAFFEALPGRLEGIGSVQVQLKRGKTANELTRYRYDVVLQIGEWMGTHAVYEPFEWLAAGRSTTEIETALGEQRLPAMRFSSVPNSRLAREVAAKNLIESSDERQEAGVLRNRLDALQLEEVDPETFWNWGETHGYDVEVNWGLNSSEDGDFGVQLLDKAHPVHVPRTISQACATPIAWSAYANDPMENSFRQQLIPQLRDDLKTRLPEYMIPSAWVALKQLPLTPNGKVDRHALPAPLSRPEEMGDYLAPRTDMERKLAEIWAQVLRIDQVGAQDNFFELGGHSLLIVQMMERLRRAGLPADVSSIYASPTLADLALRLSGGAASDFVVPPNLIEPACEAITPQLLPLVNLVPEEIAQIVQGVPGGTQNIQDIYPLTPMQEGMLFHYLLNQRGGDTYVRLMLFSFSSRERLEEFTRALQKVIDRHDILRTAVLWEKLSQPVQVVCRRVIVAVEELMLDPHRDAVDQLKERMTLERQSLDLRRAPLMRLQIAADTQGGRWHTLLQTHHLVCDNESLEILIAEVMACVEGRAQELPEPVAYRNHVAQVLAHAKTHDAEAFFRSKLGEIVEPTAPFGLLNVHGDGGRIEEFRLTLQPALAQRTRAEARRLGVTAATLFHAAWALVVAGTSGRDDVVYGTVLLGRMQGGAGAQQTLGMFINTLPLRLPLQDVSVGELVQRTQRELIELLKHDQAPLAVAQRCTGIAGSAPLFSTLLNYTHSMPHVGSGRPGMASGIQVLMSQEWTNYPIVLSVEDLGTGFMLTAQTDWRIDPQRMTGYLQTALQSLVDALERAPQKHALALTILPESERHQVIESFNPGRTDYPAEHLIHERFESQVERAPGALAVLFEGQSLTYGDLNRRANQLARHLRARGVGPDQLVGICVERGLDMIVGLLGILKAGGAYVPLDPNYPTERLAYMLKDAAPRVVLTQERLIDRLSWTAGDTIALDRDWQAISTHYASNLDARVTGARPHHLAYVIYTSGSTGKPKGVMIEHRNVVRLFAATEHWFEFNAGDTWTLFHSFAFDFSVWELWGALLHGGRLIVVPYLTTKSAEEFYRLLCEQRVTVLNQTPSAFAQLIDAQGRGALSQHSLRLVIFGGEALELHTLRQWVERNGAQRPLLVNMYGITETTVHVTYHALRREEVETERSGVVGRPIPDLRVYLLDARGQPVPIGVAGEICVGGAGVARGYLARSELTAERFIRDPFGGEPGARLYRSGDLGRWRADGTLEHLGRNDQQVKIRGYRIELGEIEAQLGRHDQVKEAVVVVREDAPGDKRLVAYFTQRDETGPGVEELRAYLEAVLPEHMIPSAFVLLPALPLTPNGKSDRRALPKPDLEAFAARQYEAPRGAVEEALAGIWQELLLVERVGRQDHFFELGGHSLLIVQMLERLRRAGLSAQVRSVFEHPTLAALAGTLTGETGGQFEVPPNLIPPGCEVITPQLLSLIELNVGQIEQIVQSVPGGAANIQDIYPLAPLQEGILFHHLLNRQGGDTYVLPTLLTLCSRERLNELIGALQKVIDRHDVLRTAVLWEHLPRPVQVVCRRAPLPVEELVLDRDGDPVAQLKDLMRPERQWLDLRQAPLMRLQVAAAAQGPGWYALLQMHHLATDHMAHEIVIAEVMAYLDDSTPSLPEPVAYRNHVAQALAYGRTHDAEAFFRSKLGDIDGPTAPFGLLDVHGDGTRIDDFHLVLESGLASRVRVQARRLGVSAATLFHAGWGLVVARTSGRDEVVYGSVLLGRMQVSAGAQQILGMFINTLPLRLRLHDISVRQLVEQTQRELVELLNHEQASLALAQRCSGVTGGAPLFSSLLNYRHSVANPDGEQHITAPGVRVLASEEWTNYPVTLSVDDLGEGFALTASTDRRVAPSRMTGYLQTAMQSLVEALEHAPGTQALSLPILPESERQQVLAIFNATQVDYPREKLIHELFEEQARSTPDAVAAVYEEHSLTYAELNRRANQLARRLRSHGIGPDQLVAICVERSVEMIVGLLGILKAGGAYVPLDPSYPAERLQYMLQDAAPQVVLTQRKLSGLLPSTRSVVIELDAASDETTASDRESLTVVEQGLTASNLIYVIYTSGSTGRPKGTAMAHRSMVNLIEWHRRTFNSGEGKRVLQFAALSFDVAFQETFSTLCTGGTLVLLDEWVRRDARALTEFCSSHSIQRLFVPPLMLQSLAQYSATTGVVPEGLQDVIAAGEQLRISPEVVSFFRKLNGCRLHNHYGPTETHVVTALTLTGSPDQWPALPSIGRPISNTFIHILDRQRQPVPTGVTGEIYIGGPGVARGYLRRPDLTAQRFSRDPFSADPQALLYATGDLGQWQADATLEYLGRHDDQVKIRGYRVELAEIEARLARHAQVKEAAVVAREDAHGGKRLLAYVTPRDEGVPSVEALRGHLKNDLPEYMIPGAFVVLERLPLTPSGKLDRRALPAPELGAYLSRQYEAPRGAVELALAEVWQELLCVERVGRQDNFFELGGHSVLAMQVIARISASLSIDIPMRLLFEFPTVTQLSAKVDELRQLRLLEVIAEGGDSVEELLERVASMPERQVQDLMQQARMEERS